MTNKEPTASEKFAMIQKMEAGHMGVQEGVQEGVEDAVKRFGITNTTLANTTITNTTIIKTHHHSNHRQLATSVSRVWLGGIRDSYSLLPIFH
ncbi:hypothetical protein D3C77_377860 [compost metagenome]